MNPSSGSPIMALAAVPVLAILAALPHSVQQAEAAATGRPNIIFILIDDLGWADIGCYGSRFHETPNIDRLASQGMRFTNAYAACCVCSPTRASIMTGRYPARLHLTDWIPGHNAKNPRLQIPAFRQELPLEETTIAEALKPAGYTSASIGKWHLGKEPYYPEKQGFDLNFGGSHLGHPPSYFCPYKLPGINTGRPGEYLTDRLTHEAEDFLEQNKDRPFFLYWAHYAVHTPLQGKEQMVAKYQAKADPNAPQKNPIYAAVLQSVDEGVGRIMRRLEELRIADRTIIFFMSDNGGLSWVTSNAPLREGKGTMYEGGLREPMIVRWPGVIRPGSTCDIPVISTDFLPTILDAAGLRPDPAVPLDGLSLMPLLRQTGSLQQRSLYWHYPHYHPCGATPSGAIRQGDLKLIESYENGRLELYNLKEDLGETQDLSKKMPEKAAELQKNLADWRKAVDAQMPTPNPQYKNP